MKAPSRRTVLTLVAGAGLASTAAGEGINLSANKINVLAPKTSSKEITPSQGIEGDPIYALIAEKRATDVAHSDACDAISAAEERYGVDSDEAEAAFENGGPACDAAYAASWPLATTQPTTLAGVVAVLRFANEIEDAGNEWPNTDVVGRDGWHYKLRATMAAAIEALLNAQAGKAVRS
jgi:hypothetical protein